MEFLAGMIVGSLLTIGSGFVFKFYKTSEEKDRLLAEAAGRKFEEKIRLEPKDK
jgi:hypothetical protein